MVDKMSSSFRFLDLPNELRLKMYRFILPRGERIHLDPELVQFPIPYIVEDSYGTTFDLLQVCKKVHDEATQFIYRNNMVNIIATKDAGDFLEDLGITACQYITKLECHVTGGLVDLGNIWSTMTECPRLTDVRLVFYHELWNWSKTLAQLAYHKQTYDDDECLQILDIEFHTSIWARHHSALDYAEQFNLNLDEAERHAKIYRYEIPPQLRHVTIAASVHRVAADNYADWEDRASEWVFDQAGCDDTDMKKTLRFRRSL